MFFLQEIKKLLINNKIKLSSKKQTPSKQEASIATAFETNMSEKDYDSDTSSAVDEEEKEENISESEVNKSEFLVLIRLSHEKNRVTTLLMKNLLILQLYLLMRAGMPPRSELVCLNSSILIL